MWTLGTLGEFSISTKELCEIQYLLFPCVRAIRRLWVCTSRPLMPKASRSALRRCPGGPGGFRDESARPRAIKIKVRYSTDGSVAIVPNVSNKNKEFYPFLTRPLAQPRSVVPSVVNRIAQHFLNGERAGACEAVGNAPYATVGVGTSGRILGHHSLYGRKLRFGLRPIRVA